MWHWGTYVCLEESHIPPETCFQDPGIITHKLLTVPYSTQWCLRTDTEQALWTAKGTRCGGGVICRTRQSQKLLTFLTARADLRIFVSFAFLQQIASTYQFTEKGEKNERYTIRRSPNYDLMYQLQSTEKVWIPGRLRQESPRDPMHLKKNKNQTNGDGTVSWAGFQRALEEIAFSSLNILHRPLEGICTS